MKLVSVKLVTMNFHGRSIFWWRSTYGIFPRILVFSGMYILENVWTCTFLTRMCIFGDVCTFFNMSVHFSIRSVHFRTSLYIFGSVCTFLACIYMNIFYHACAFLVMSVPFSICLCIFMKRSVHFRTSLYIFGSSHVHFKHVHTCTFLTWISIFGDAMYIFQYICMHFW